MVKNSAFVFIKPHAVTDKCKELVARTFEQKGIAIKKEGSIEAEEIDKKMLIDQHYYAIAAKATILTPDKLEVPKEKFKEKFGVEFADCLNDGTAINAKQASEKFETTAAELEALWRAGDIIKFGGGFYCSKMTAPKGEGPFYVFNGFFMSMRDKFVVAGASIYYYVVEWESDSLSWADFRGTVLGPTDPSKAPAESLRGAILKDWKDLGLAAEPSTGDNGVHASASPFEALAERMNWLSYRPERDYFGKLLVYKAGVTRKQIKEWCEDPQVTYGPSPISTSLFDALEDTDSDWCLALCQMIGDHCQPKESSKDLEKEIGILRAEIEKYKSLADAVMFVKGYKETKLPKASPKKKTEELASSAARSTGKGSRAKEEPAKSKGKGRESYESGKGKFGKGFRDRNEWDYYNEPPPLRQRQKGGKSSSRGRDDWDYYNEPPLRQRPIGDKGGKGYKGRWD